MTEHPTMHELLVKHLLGLVKHLLGHMTFDSCKESSCRTVLSLRAQGIDARWIQFMGLRVSAPDADERWSSIPPSVRIHYVVKISDLYYDATARQFWPEGPLVVVSGDYASRWDREYDITDALDD